MIIGIGTDIIHIPRIESILMRRPRFVSRILVPSEIVSFENAAKPAEFLAARYAAKEAAAKALGTGFRNGVSYQHIIIQWDNMGKPQIVFAEAAKQVSTQLKLKSANLSISHEREYAIAFVVLEG